MDFGLSDNQKMFKRTFADLSDEVIQPDLYQYAFLYAANQYTLATYFVLRSVTI